MLLVLLCAGAIWFIGRKRGVSAQARWLMIALLYVLVLVEHILLPDGHRLRLLTGRSEVVWLFFGVAALLVGAYSYGLRWLKARAHPAPEPVAAAPIATSDKFTEAELERYARHIVLREIGGPGQKRLAKARVLVIGAGGLGAPALLYLAGAGVGTIGVIDDDGVENANLQRQVIHRNEDIGLPKVFSAERAMRALNPYVEIRPYHRRLTPDIAEALFEEYDLILDGTDNFDTRYLVNRMAVAKGVPLISGALSQWEGQLSVFDPSRGAPCYQCIFPQAPADGLAPSCAEAGVLGPLPGVVGAMMAAEAVKVLTDAGDPLRGRMMIYDALYGETRQIGIKPRPDCPVCGQADTKT